MINIEYEYIELKDGKRIETKVFYERQCNEGSLNTILKTELENILYTVKNISHIHFGVIRTYKE